MFLIVHAHFYKKSALDQQIFCYTNNSIIPYSFTGGIMKKALGVLGVVPAVIGLIFLCLYVVFTYPLAFATGRRFSFDWNEERGEKMKRLTIHPEFVVCRNCTLRTRVGRFCQTCGKTIPLSEKQIEFVPEKIRENPSDAFDEEC